jgi:RNA polymerase sigma factor (sigma-70 family)
MRSSLLHEPIRLAGGSMLRLQTDERLLALARAGHEPAFAALFERYRTPLTRYCTRLLGAARAEDAVQQTFVSAHGAMMKNDDDIKLKPWLYRIAHNASLNLLRSSHETAELDFESAGSDNVDEVVQLRERLSETLTAIGALPQRQRDALLLRELEGRSHEEIALALGVTEGSARQHLMRARATLRSAATALTPYPLAVKAAAAMAGGMTQTAGVSELVAGAGVTATIAKVSAGVLATGAVVAGASQVHVLPHRTHHPATPAAIARPATATSGSSSSSGAGTAGTSPALTRGATHRADLRRGKSGATTGRHTSGKHTSGSRLTQAGSQTATDHRSGRHSGPGSTTQRTSDTSGGSHRQSGRHGVHHSGTVESTTATEAPHVETEAPGDVSNKPATAGGGGTGGGGGGGGGATTVPAPAPTTTDPTTTTPVAPSGSSGGSGGSSQEPTAPQPVTP